MANVCFSSYVIDGDRGDVRRLYDMMSCLEKRKRPLVMSDYGNRWLGCLVARLGGNCKEVYCRGRWSGLYLSDRGFLCFDTETAWAPMDEVFMLVKKRLPRVNIYYMAEEDNNGVLVTNDATGKYFPARYRVDALSDFEYLETMVDVCRYVSGIIGKPLLSKEELDAAVEIWNREREEKNDCDDLIAITEFDVVTNDFTTVDASIDLY